jgi:tetratricopeptide (TPR) repeat protein
VSATPRPNPVCDTPFTTQRPVHPRGRYTGVDADPQAIRRAREAAGLSQAQLGEPLLTRQGVQSIEAGRVRPSHRSLSHIARRLNLPLEALLREGGPAADRRVLQLEQLFETHRYTEVVERAEALLRLPRLGGRLLAGAHHYAGAALYQLDRAREAVDHLRAAREQAASTPDPWLMAESLDWEAAARHLLDDTSAVDLARKALTEYRMLQPRRPEVEARMLEHLGTALGRRGAYEAAARNYREALYVAGAVQALESAGRVYHGLAGCSRQEGNIGTAIKLMRKAIDFYRIEHDFSNDSPGLALAKAENDLAMLLIDAGKLDEADELVTSALDRIRNGRVDQLRPYVLHTRSQVRQKQGDLRAAFDLAEQTVDLSTRLGLSIPLSCGLQQLGELHEAVGHRRLADSNYRRAMETLDAAGLSDRRKEVEEAYRQLRRARRSRQSRSA